MQRIQQQIWPALALMALLVHVGCASKPKVLAPPRIDLASFGTIGVIEFSANGDPQLPGYTTQEFLQTMQMAQSGVRVLELGSEKKVLRSVERGELALDAIKAIGEEYGIDAVVTGKLDVTKVKPSLKLSRSLTSVNVQANIQGFLAVKILETKSGATLWTAGARGAQPVARASLVSNGPYELGATDPQSAYGTLVQDLVYRVTDDFRSHWVKQ